MGRTGGGTGGGRGMSVEQVVNEISIMSALHHPAILGVREYYVAEAGLAPFTTLYCSQKHHLMTASMCHVNQSDTPVSDNQKNQ